MGQVENHTRWWLRSGNAPALSPPILRHSTCTLRPATIVLLSLWEMWDPLSSAPLTPLNPTSLSSLYASSLSRYAPNGDFVQSKYSKAKIGRNVVSGFKIICFPSAIIQTGLQEVAAPGHRGEQKRDKSQRIGSAAADKLEKRARKNVHRRPCRLPGFVPGHGCFICALDGQTPHGFRQVCLVQRQGQGLLGESQPHITPPGAARFLLSRGWLLVSWTLCMAMHSQLAAKWGLTNPLPWFEMLLGVRLGELLAEDMLLPALTGEDCRHHGRR
jgi:hypothetical protein